MTASPALPDLPEIAKRAAAVESVFMDEFVDIRGTTRHLRAQIDRLASIDIHRAGRDSLLDYVCEHSARTANAIARQQTANAAIMRALGRHKNTSK